MGWIPPLWTFMVVCCLVAEPVVGYPVPVYRGCVLRINSGPQQSIDLAMLTDLFREMLMTEYNKNIYYVSICRRIPLKGSTSLAGAVKFNSNGGHAVLGQIDQADIAVNEKTTVLTYIGSDLNRNLNEECNGNRWKTYLTFICDPYAINDTLKLVDEDPEPEVCQIKFDIITTKICRRNPNFVVRTPIVRDKYNNLPLIIKGLHIKNTQYNNNISIFSDVNENHLNNNGFVHIENNSKQQNLHQDDSNNYIREPYYKRRLMMNTDNLTIVKQSSENSSQEENKKNNDEQTSFFVKFITRPILVVFGAVMSLYYWWLAFCMSIKLFCRIAIKIFITLVPNWEALLKPIFFRFAVYLMKKYKSILPTDDDTIPLIDTTISRLEVYTQNGNEKLIHHHGGKEEDTAFQVATGSTAGHGEINTLAFAGTTGETDDTTDVSGDCEIPKESDIHQSKENGLGDNKMGS